MTQKQKKSDDDYHFVDTLAIIQNVAFKLEETPAPKTSLVEPLWYLVE